MHHFLSMTIGTRPMRYLSAPALMMLASCASVGSIMSPYSEKFSCRNADHGQCIDPGQAYADAVAGRASRSDPGLTNDRKLLKNENGAPSRPPNRARGTGASADVPAGYRDSLYRELQGLIDQPVTPMLKPPRTIRTLILPYSSRERPDRLYMSRYVYAIIETPAWVVGNYLAAPIEPASLAPVLGQMLDRPLDPPAAAPEPRP